MKNRITYMAALMAAAFVSVWSCSKMNDLHQVYLERGEVVYAAKADSVKAYIGVNQQVLEIFVPSQRAVRGEITWNLKENRHEFEIPEGDSKSVKVTISDLQEGSYTYEVVLFDAFGNSSIPVEVTSNVLSQEAMDNYRQMFEHSAFYEVYPDLLEYFNSIVGVYQEEIIMYGQVYEDSPAFKWSVGSLPAGGTVYVTYTTTAEEQKTRTYQTNKIKVGYCMDFTDACVDTEHNHKITYYTEYLGVPYDPEKSTITIDKDIDLGEEYADRYYHYHTTVGFEELAANIDGCTMVCHSDQKKIDITYNEREEDWIL